MLGYVGANKKRAMCDFTLTAARSPRDEDDER